MPNRETLDALLAAAARRARDQEAAAARIAARAAWVNEVVPALFAAQDRVHQAWIRMFDALPDDLTDEQAEALPEPPEQAELDALQAQIDAVLERDQWPPHLYWGDI
jgi:hypothetical protein